MNATYIVAGLIINALRPRALLGVAAILIGILVVQKEASAAILVLHPSGAFPGDTAVYDPDAVTALDSNDGDDTMGELDSSGGKFYLELDDPAASGTINSVQVKIVVRYSGTGNTMQFKIGVGTGGTFYLSPTITHSTDGYAEYGGDIYTTNPQTNAPWTWADIASLVAAVDYGVDCCRMYITELYAEIDYTPGTAITLSGVLFSDEGITPVSGQTVRLVVEGNSVGTDITDLGGNYSISAVINPTYNIWYIPLLVYVDDGVVDATTVTTMDSTVNAGAIPDLHLYADHLITRQDASSAPLDTGDMNAAKGSYADTDILYSISWPDTTVTGANTELYIPGGHGFTPFGNIATPHLKSNGTLNAGGNTFTVSGNWEHASGTFNSGTSLVDLTGSGSVTVNDASWWEHPFYNLSAAAAGQTTTIPATRGIAVENTLVLNSGVLTGGDVLLNKSSGTPLITNATLDNGDFMYSTQAAGTVYVAAADYPAGLRVAGWGNGATSRFELAGDITCGSLQVAGTDSGSITVLDTSANSYSIGCSGLEVGASWNSSIYNRLVLNNSLVDINGPVSIVPSDAGGANEIDAGGATINVGGNWSNRDSFVAGTSTVVLDGAGQTLSGSTAFHNLTKTVTGSDTLTFTAGTTQHITGSVVLSSASGQLLNLRSSTPGIRWNFNLAAGATKAISHVDVQDSDASGSDVSQLEINPAYSVDSANNVSWFGNANISVVKSSVVLSDPVSGALNPKRIPGAVVEYTIVVTNTAGAQATNIRLADDLSAEQSRIAFVPDGYAPLKGIQLISPNINGGVALNLTNADDSDQGDYGITAANTITVGGMILDAGEQATIKFKVMIQ